MNKLLFFIIFAFNSTLLAENKYAKLHLGLGIFQAEKKAGGAPSNGRTGNGYQLEVRSAVHLASATSIAPYVSYNVLPITSDDGSYKVSYSVLGAPAKISLAKVTGSSSTDVDFSIIAGPSILRYTIKGTGGVGGKDGDEMRPSETRNIYYLATNIGFQVDIKNKVLISIDTLWTQILNTKARNMHLLIGAGWNVL